MEAFYVKRLKPTDEEAYKANPTQYIGSWDSDPHGEVGRAVVDHILTLSEPSAPGGIRVVPLLGIIWTFSKRPAITYEDPTFLENIDDFVEDTIAGRVQEELDKYDDDEDEEDEEGEENKD